MSKNFSFLKNINNNLYEIISAAEKLYSDEYFEQCITQTGRFAESVCKSMFEENNRPIGTFDEMIETLKDNSTGNIQEKEFIDDLYFIKKNRNKSVHSTKVKNDAMVALECLKRSFEIAINYCVYNHGATSDILKLNYDVELLITGKKSQTTLKEKYEKAKSTQKESTIKKEQPVTKPNKTNTVKQQKQVKNKVVKSFQIPIFWKFILILSTISLLTILFLVIAIIL